MLNIVTYGDPVLTKKAQEISAFDHDLEKIVIDMQDAMQRDHGIGLAAPQVGISKRLFLVGLDDEPLRIFVNPRIVAMSKETNE